MNFYNGERPVPGFRIVETIEQFKVLCMNWDTRKTNLFPNFCFQWKPGIQDRN
jgi:hypothetical protein